eukprot:403343020
MKLISFKNYTQRLETAHLCWLDKNTLNLASKQDSLIFDTKRKYFKHHKISSKNQNNCEDINILQKLDSNFAFANYKSKSDDNIIEPVNTPCFIINLHNHEKVETQKYTMEKESENSDIFVRQYQMSDYTLEITNLWSLDAQIQVIKVNEQDCKKIILQLLSQQHQILKLTFCFQNTNLRECQQDIQDENSQHFMIRYQEEVQTPQINNQLLIKNFMQLTADLYMISTDFQSDSPLNAKVMLLDNSGQVKKILYHTPSNVQFQKLKNFNYDSFPWIILKDRFNLCIFNIRELQPYKISQQNILWGQLCTLRQYRKASKLVVISYTMGELEIFKFKIYQKENESQIEQEKTEQQ